MKIVIDMTSLYDHLSGIERYNLNIAYHMIIEHPECNFVLIFKNEIHTDFVEITKLNNVTVRVISECNKLIFIQYKLYKVINKIEADYYLFMSFTSPVFLKKPGIINVIHDMTCWDSPETIPLKMIWYYRVAFAAAVKNSKFIVTVSEFSKKRIINKYNLKPNDVRVINPGLSSVFLRRDENIIDKIANKYMLPNEYILSLSTIEPRKNLQLLIKAYGELLEEGNLLPDLVLAGRKGWKLEEIMCNISPQVEDKIHFIGFVDDNDLPILYSNAKIFVFPSKYEGFGLPVVEAMSQGTVVLSSDAASLPEVVDNGGVLFKSENMLDLKEKIRFVLEMSQEQIKEVSQNAMVVTNRYNWKHSAKKFYDLLSEE